MNPIITIEGISFSGKTTLTKILEREGFARLYELAEKFDYGARFPKFAKNTEEAKQNDLWFLQQEIIREKEMILISNNKPVIADRSFVSALAFAYAREEVFGIGDMFYQSSIIKQAVNNGQLHLPWVVYLNIDIDNFFKRKRNDEERRIIEYGENAVKNMKVHDKEKEFFEKQIEYYARTLSKIPYLELDALQDRYDLVAKVKDWSQKLTTQFPSINIDDLLVKHLDTEK